MKKYFLAVAIVFSGLANAQKNVEFNEQAALQEAQQKGISPVDYPGYINKKYYEWKKANGLLRDENALIQKNEENINLQSATNIDFETGDYTGWQTEIGRNGNWYTGLPDGVIGLIHTSPNGPINQAPYLICGSDSSYRHGLISTAFVGDTIIKTSLVSPLSGNYVARVGRFCYNGEVSILKQTFNITAGQQVLKIAYLPVLEAPSHTPNESPFMTVYVLDTNLDTIPNTFIEMKNLIGYDTVSVYYPNDVCFKPWTTSTFDLSSYVGQNVTLKVEASACAFGGHSGYGYFDAILGGTSLGIENNLQNLVSVYPNPANGFIHLTNVTNNLKYEVYDLTGRNVLNGEMNGAVSIDISMLPEGAYTLKINSGNEVAVKKFVKSK